MFNPSRDQARLFFIDTWRKFKAREALSAMEDAVAELLVQHPEYHALLEDPQAAHKDFAPEDGQINPFLHLSLHLAIHEQLSINQPPGLREAFDALLTKHYGDRHAALHDVLECLAEQIWSAQRHGTPLDGEAYINSVKRRAGRGVS